MWPESCTCRDSLIASARLGRMRFSSFIVVVSLALAARPASLDAQVGGTTDIITGRVTGPEGQPLLGARVEVMSLETDVTRTRTTDQNGRYTILFPDGGGQYRMTVRYIGMQPVDRKSVV